MEFEIPEISDHDDPRIVSVSYDSSCPFFTNGNKTYYELSNLQPVSRVDEFYGEPNPAKRAKGNDTSTDVGTQTEDDMDHRTLLLKAVVDAGLDEEDLDLVSGATDDDSVQSFLYIMFSICSRCYTKLSPRHITIQTPTQNIVIITQECPRCGCKRTWTTKSFSRPNPNFRPEPSLSLNNIIGTHIKEEIVSDEHDESDCDDLAAASVAPSCSGESVMSTTIKKEIVSDNEDENDTLDLAAMKVVPIVCSGDPTAYEHTKEIPNNESVDDTLAASNGRFWFSDSIELFPDVQSATSTIFNEKRWVFHRNESLKYGSKMYFKCCVANCPAVLISHEHNSSSQSGMVTVFRNEPHTNHDLANNIFEHSENILPD